MYLKRGVTVNPVAFDDDLFGDGESLLEILGLNLKHLQDFRNLLLYGTRLTQAAVATNLFMIDTYRYQLNQILIGLEYKMKISYEYLSSPANRFELERIVKILVNLGESININKKYLEYGLELFGLEKDNFEEHPLVCIYANRFINELLLEVTVLSKSTERLLEMLRHNRQFSLFLKTCAEHRETSQYDGLYS